MPEKPLLFAYDGSEGARRAIRVAGELLAGREALVLHVADDISAVLVPAGVPGVPVPPPAPPEQDARQEEAARAVAEEGVEQATAAGLRAQPLVRFASGTSAIASAISEVAEEQDAAAIIVGSRGRSPIAAAFLGSVAYHLVHDRTRPVLTVPQPA